MKKILYIVLGCISVGLGALGAVLPILPTVPFLMLTAFCFARSSEKLDRWFRSTKLYEENLKDFVAGKGMAKKTKIRTMVTVTLLMSIGFVVMGLRGILSGCVVLGLVWVPHCLLCLRRKDLSGRARRIKNLPVPFRGRQISCRKPSYFTITREK